LLILELSTSQEIKIVLFFCFASSVSLLKSIGDHRGELPYSFFPVLPMLISLPLTLKIVELTILELSDRACWSLVKLPYVSMSLIDANFFSRTTQEICSC
jgi:hypothetical protein